MNDLYLVSLYAILFASLAIVLVFLGYALGLFYSVYKGAPYVSSGRRMAERMMELADVQNGMLVVDLGAGDGEICFAAVARGARAMGVDANPWLIWISRLRARWNKAAKRTSFVCVDLWNYRIPVNTDVVCVYLLPGMYGRLWEKLCIDLKPGTKVVSHAFRFPDRKPIKEVDGVYLYQI